MSDPAQAERGPEPSAESGAGRRMLIDFGPLVAFIVAYKLQDLIVATGVLVVATILATAASWLLERRLPVMTIITGVVVLIFGGLTVYTKNETFIKLKPTIVSGLIGSILIGGLLFGRPLLKPVLGQAMEMTEAGWRILTLRYGLFFVFLAAVNEVVWRNFSENFWVNFKVFGILALTFVFAITQVPVMQRHAIEPNESS